MIFMVEDNTSTAKSPSTEEGGPDADKGRKLHVEPTLPIYLKVIHEPKRCILRQMVIWFI